MHNTELNAFIENKANSSHNHQINIHQYLAATIIIIIINITFQKKTPHCKYYFNKYTIFLNIFRWML